MLALFIIVVAAGMAIPFLMEEKERILGYSLNLISIVLLIVMVRSDIAGLPGYEKTESIAIGTCMIVLGIVISKGYRIINPKSKVAKAKKTHRQQQQNHKAAS